MSLNTAMNNVQKTQFIELLHESLGVRSHREFLLWSQGNMQEFLPHDIMIAAWGDFSLGLIYLDIVSALPQVRTDQMHCANLAPLLQRLFDYWDKESRVSFAFQTDAGIFKENEFGCNNLNSYFKGMKSALVHGIKDARGRHDCLYVLLNSKAPSLSCRTMLEALLPYIDSSLRQLDHFPEQIPHTPSCEVGMEPLSGRELEIMEWVQNGKTNFEIGMILDISAFTVKNHLQRIFKKLDVMNRAQAVAKLGRLIEQNESI